MKQDEKTIKAIAARDEAAIARVISKYEKLLWKIVTGALGSAGAEEDAEECVADVFIRLWLEPDKFDPARGSLKTYLSVMARSVALDRRRMLARLAALRTGPIDNAPDSNESALPDQSRAADSDPAQQLVKTEELAELQEAINMLSEDERTIIIERYVRGRKPREIAPALGMEIKQVKNQIYRAKKKLGRILEEKRCNDHD